MKLSRPLLLPAGICLLCVTTALAQSRAPIPTLTTDDVVGTKPTSPVASTTAEVPGKKPGEKTPAPAEKPADEAKQRAEKEWGERLKKAQEKHRDLAHRADATELQITQLRNQLFSATSRAPESNNQLNARIADLSTLRNRLLAEAQTAQQDVARLEAEGQSNSYKVAAVSLTNEKGEPDAQAYQAESNRLQQEAREAQARLEVLQLRLNSLQGEVLKKGNGDNHTLNRLRQERDNTTTELQETRGRLEDLKNKIQEHRKKAAAVGVTLGGAQ